MSLNGVIEWEDYGNVGCERCVLGVVWVDEAELGFSM